MALKALLHVILFAWIAAAEPIVEGHCKNHCGKVTIPFPFGIGPPECYISDWFEITCTEGKTVPRLRRANLTVTEISVVEGTVKVMNPVTFANCTDKNETRTMMRQAPDLRGSPFLFSQEKNKYTAVSCGFIAMMSSGTGDVGGCMSICSGKQLVNRSCNGMDCCQTTIPSNLRAFNTNFSRIRSESKKNCRYAFLADTKWFDAEPMVFRTIRRRIDHVPVVLEWELYNTTREVFGTDEVKTNKSAAESRVSDYLQDESTGSYVGYTNSTCRYLVNNSTTRLQCYCTEGYTGNPYLLRGCRDIDECKDANVLRLCPSAHCLNTNGYYICSAPSTNKMSPLFISLGSGLGALFLLGFGVWLHKFIKKRNKIRRRAKFFNQNGGPFLQQKLFSIESSIEKTKLYKSKELEKATDRFNENRILGQGGQGTVYKGMLTDGKIVAVKKSKIVDRAKLTEFINEIIILSQINHRNVVKVLGCCLETEVPLLVYEYIPNGTLSELILDQNGDFPLTWEMRIRIATEVAEALSYLHSSASNPIFHRDIKSSNILLDEKYRAKVADFGTSRSVSVDQTHLTTSLVHGTFGYLDPEYFQSSQFTEKSDVYSFGVVLVELLTGQRPIIPLTATNGGGRSLATHFLMSMEEDSLFDIVDARVAKEAEREAVTTFAELAKRCLDLSGKKRPAMREVASVLEDIQRTITYSLNAHIHNRQMVDDENVSDIEVEPCVNTSSSTSWFR